MPVSLDFNLLPILRREGQDQTNFPGLYAVTPPRRAVHGRDQDNLVLYLTLAGNLFTPPELQVELLTRLAQKYYKTGGTVTSALRSLADMLNQILLERNLRNPGVQSIGYLSQLVLRGNQITLAHSGPCQAFHLTPAEVKEATDLETSGRGLGYGRSVTLRFFQLSIQPNEFIFLTHQPAQDWQLEGLRISSNQGMEGLRRRLLIGRPDPDLNAVLIQAVSGSGKLRFLRLKSNLPEMARPQVDHTPIPTSEQAPASPLASEEEVEHQPSLAGETAEEAQRAMAESRSPLDAQLDNPLEESSQPEARPSGPGSPEPVDVVAIPQNIPPEAALAGEAQVSKPVTGGPIRADQTAAQRSKRTMKVAPARKSHPKLHLQFTGLRRIASSVLNALAVIQKAFASAAQQVGRALLVLLGRLLPDESMFSISPRTLVFIAIAVPLLVGVVGGMVYVERGQSSQYQQYYDQALQTSADAFIKTDPIEQRLAWQTTIELLEKAENYRLTPESQALRAMAQEALDELDGIERLDFKPALTSSLDRETHITKLVVNGGDLYMLNGAQGSVIRAVLTGGGYQLDPQFICGPVAAGSAVVGPLVDIVPLARGDETKASLMGIDASGTLIFCVPGGQPFAQPVNPPATNFGEVRALDWNANTLYLLDPGSNAVWFYASRNIAEPPRFFFGDEIPYMQDVIDLAVSNRDLYLLHADGHQTFCVYQAEATRCEDPFEYADLRQGRTGGPVIPDALFTQIQFAPPPDPSLFLLEPKSQAIYHFSLRLMLQRQYRPLRSPGDEPVSAFTVSAARTVFLALGNRVFFASLP
jgi:hypothetical protein